MRTRGDGATRACRRGHSASGCRKRRVATRAGHKVHADPRAARDRGNNQGTCSRRRTQRRGAPRPLPHSSGSEPTISSSCVHGCGKLGGGASLSSSSTGATATVADATASCTGAGWMCGGGSCARCCGACACMGAGICRAGCRVGCPGTGGWPAAAARVALSAAKTAAAPCAEREGA